MTDIEALAREAGITFKPAGRGDDGIDTWFGDQYLPNGALARFAALVAERCAQKVEFHVEDAVVCAVVADSIRLAFPMPRPMSVYSNH